MARRGRRPKKSNIKRANRVLDSVRREKTLEEQYLESLPEDIREKVRADLDLYNLAAQKCPKAQKEPFTINFTHPHVDIDEGGGCEDCRKYIEAERERRRRYAEALAKASDKKL